MKILVAGDMKELGDDTDTAHRSVGEYASAANISAVWATGEKSKLLVGSYQGESRYFQCKQDLITALRDSMNA